MIQRIQSIYLLLAAILMAATAFSPIFGVEGQTVFSFGIKEGEAIIKPTWGIVSMAGLSAILSFVTIFMFKNRKKQGTITSICALLILFFYVTTIAYMLSYYDDFLGTLTSPEYGIFLPIISLIFTFLAKIRIAKDEKLVRSLDRIR